MLCDNDLHLNETISLRNYLRAFIFLRHLRLFRDEKFFFSSYVSRLSSDGWSPVHAGVAQLSNLK